MCWISPAVLPLLKEGASMSAAVCAIRSDPYTTPLYLGADAHPERKPAGWRIRIPGSPWIVMADLPDPLSDEFEVQPLYA